MIVGSIGTEEVIFDTSNVIRFINLFYFIPAIPLIYVKEGSISVGQQIMSAHTGKSYVVKDLWFQRPDEENVKTMLVGFDNVEGDKNVESEFVADTQDKLVALPAI